MEMSHNHVATSPVVMFEAPQGSLQWNTRALVGELQLTLVDNVSVRFQLRGVLDRQRLFDYVLCDPRAFSEISPKFFVIRHENGSHKGFGFSNKAAAEKIKAVVQKAAEELGLSIGRHSLQSDTKSRITSREPRAKRFKVFNLFSRSDMEIGYPTDVKHIGHIGWDSYNEELNPRFQSFDSPTETESPPQPPSQFVANPIKTK